MLFEEFAICELLLPDLVYLGPGSWISVHFHTDKFWHWMATDSNPWGAVAPVGFSLLLVLGCLGPRSSAKPVHGFFAQKPQQYPHLLNFECAR